MKTKKLLALTECSIMIALSTVLSLIKIAELPYGGSITIASMLPIVVAVYRHGGAWGFGCALVNAFIQMLLGLNNFSYFTTWQSVIALAIFDYVLAFVAFAIAGIFKKKIKNQAIAMMLGALLASVLRYACHVISGATVWAGLSIPSEAALIYSFSYNATYMLPETVVLIIATLYIGSVIDFTRPTPTRMQTTFDRTTAYLYMGAGLSALCGIIASVAIVFPVLQDPESGEFIFSNIANADFPALGIALGISLFIAASLVVIAKLKKKN